MRWVIATIVLVVSCDAGQAPSASPSKAPPPVAAPADARLIDAPDAGGPLDAYLGLVPEATSDGAFVRITVEQSTGARDAVPNGTLTVRDRSDRVLESVLVQKVDEVIAPDEARRRAAAATRLLASHAWVALEQLEEDPTDDAPLHRRFLGAGLVVTWGGERFTIVQDGKRVVDRAVPMAWRAPRHHLAIENVDCENPDTLKDVRILAGARLAVVTVGYRGSDTCWEPTTQDHVVSW